MLLRESLLTQLCERTAKHGCLERILTLLQFNIQVPELFDEFFAIAGEIPGLLKLQRGQRLAQPLGGIILAAGKALALLGKAIRQIGAFLAQRSLSDELDAAGINVEDIAADHFAKSLGQRIWMTWFMMFPDELRNAGGLNRWQRWKFSCLHFVMKNKAAMIESYVEEMLSGTDRHRFLRALEIN